MPTETNPPTWIQKTADSLAKSVAIFDPEHGLQDAVAMIESALEAAGEIKAVRLKILLARCLEVIRNHDGFTECDFAVPDDLLGAIEVALGKSP